MKIIKLAIHSILHFRMYSGINMLGMALGLACVITIFRYVYGEYTVEHYNKNLDRIFVTTLERSTNPGESRFSGITKRYGVDLTEHSGVENYTYFTWFEKDEIDVDNRKYNATALMVDSNFLKITDYSVISGTSKLAEPNSALMTKNFAQKVFGDENPVGKTFKHSTGRILTITGIIGQTSTKSMLSFDIIVSDDLLRSASSKPMPLTLVLLYPGVDYRIINQQYEAFFEEPYWKTQMRYQLFPLSKVYFDKSRNSHVFKQGNHNYAVILLAVGVLILLVGVVNYINISTVVVLRRGRELGIKKVFGAEGHNIFMQLLTENILMMGIALISALLITRTANPFVTNILQLDQIPNIGFDVFLSFAILLCLPVMTTLYPFFRHQYSTPVRSMQNFDKTRSTGNLRQIFLSFQYIVTIVMIVVSLVFVRQLQFMLNADLGYGTKEIVKVQFQKEQLDNRFSSADERKKMRDNENRVADEIVQKMNACPLFTHWTYGKSPNELSGETLFKIHDGEYQKVNLNSAGESWFRLFDIPLKEGRLWNDETDSFYDYSLIVTEAVLKLYGITDFNDALLQPEQRLWMSMLRPKEEMETNPPYRIIGVVKDFNYSHLSKPSDPIAFTYSPKFSDGSLRYSSLMASIVPGRTQDAIEFLGKLHEETVGGEFSYSFVEDEIREMYREDKKIATIYSIFTFIAIFISGLGLFSMSLFDVQQRRKEIAIRKINGASFFDIIRLLLKKYFQSLAVSFVIAVPVALFAIHRYLEGFANKAPVSWWLFALAGVITVCISLLTLVYQTNKAASQNPAEVVKSE